MGNGTRQGGVLSPYLFSRYILQTIFGTAIGCFIGNHCFNVLAYADDLVILAPSWRDLQRLLDVLLVQSLLIDLSCNISKTVCMVFVPKNRSYTYSIPQCSHDSELVSVICSLSHNLSILDTTSLMTMTYNA